MLIQLRCLFEVVAALRGMVVIQALAPFGYTTPRTAAFD